MSTVKRITDRIPNTKDFHKVKDKDKQEMITKMSITMNTIARNMLKHRRYNLSHYISLSRVIKYGKEKDLNLKFNRKLR